jgi:peptidoglycan/xylan/chitin deacetylase (PgdA/CDA1 family)
MQPAVIHIDLDGAEDIYEVHGWDYPGGMDTLFETGLRRALRFFAENHIQATLFVIARNLKDPRKRDLLREALRQGHEIASHTMTHRHLTKLTSAEKREEIFSSRKCLSDFAGTDVQGFRAPGFHIDRECLELLAEAGYGYDSSVFPSATVPHTPHRPLGELTELPMPGASPLPFPFHPCFSLVLGMHYFDFALRRFRARNVPMVLLFHLTDFAGPLPDMHTQPLLRRFYTLSYLTPEEKLESCGRMLNAVREQFQIVTTAALLNGAALEKQPS